MLPCTLPLQIYNLVLNNFAFYVLVIRVRTSFKIRILLR